MNSYRVHLKGPDGQVVQNVELAQKNSSPAPTVGQQLEGNVDQGEYGLKFRKSFGGGQPTRAKSPQEQAAIQRMHLQKTAPLWAEFLLTIGVVPAPSNDQEAFKLMTRVMDWLERDIDKAKAKAA
jgi:hypothetical protein